MPKSFGGDIATSGTCSQLDSTVVREEYRCECAQLVEKIRNAARLERPMQVGVAARTIVDASLRHESDSVARLAILIEAAAMRNDLGEAARLLPELAALVEDSQPATPVLQAPINTDN